MFSHDKNNRFSTSRTFSATLAMLCVAVILTLGATHASAAQLYFDSFEAGTGTPGHPFLGDGAFLLPGNGWVNLSSPAVLVADPVDAHFTGTGGDDAQGVLPDGGQLMWNRSGSSVSKTLVATTVLGTTYTLSAEVGVSKFGAPSAISLLLFVDSSQVASAIGTPSTVDGFETFTTTPYVATANGDLIEIRINAAGDEFSWVDAVQLDAVEAPAGVPEPSTFVLAALGLAGLGLVAWRRRK